MKTIGWMDRCEGRTYWMYIPDKRTKKNTRIQEAFEEMRGLGNVLIFYMKGKTARKIGVRRR